VCVVVVAWFDRAARYWCVVAVVTVAVAVVFVAVFAAVAVAVAVVVVVAIVIHCVRMWHTEECCAVYVHCVRACVRVAR